MMCVFQSPRCLCSNCSSTTIKRTDLLYIQELTPSGCACRVVVEVNWVNVMSHFLTVDNV